MHSNSAEDMELSQVVEVIFVTLYILVLCNVIMLLV